jgi:hypothetical protein
MAKRRRRGCDVGGDDGIGSDRTAISIGVVAWRYAAWRRIGSINGDRWRHDMGGVYGVNIAASYGVLR